MLWLENKNINLCSAERTINSSFTAWALANNSDLRSVYKVQSKIACDSLFITLKKDIYVLQKVYFRTCQILFVEGLRRSGIWQTLHDVLKVKSYCNTAPSHIQTCMS